MWISDVALRNGPKPTWATAGISTKDDFGNAGHYS